ncbi:MAG TPA: LEPR-XLL domain-containing protein, partial [Arenicellales bacterium]|nr:LEPR-XLL domain-containing protein [Arenicellales bacterium]
MSDLHKKRKPSFRQLTTQRSNRRLMPRLRQSLFARGRLRRRSRQGNPMLLSDVTQMLRRIASGGDELRNETGIAHSQVIFEALEPRILLSADGLMPPPTPDMFDDNPEPEEVVLPPSELDEEVVGKLPE